MNNELILTNTTEEPKHRSVLSKLASRYDMEPKHFEQIVKKTCMPTNKDIVITNEQFAAFLLVASEYGLNPITKEVYAFPAKGGGIIPIVGVDGWAKIINNHPQFDGVQFVDNFDSSGKISSVECRIYRKDRGHPICVTEYLDECRRPTEPWNKWPIRMLRHKALIQCARYAFGFSGIVDEDEADRIIEATEQKNNINKNGHIKEAFSSIAKPKLTESSINTNIENSNNKITIDSQVTSDIKISEEHQQSLELQ